MTPVQLVRHSDPAWKKCTVFCTADYQQCSSSSIPYHIISYHIISYHIISYRRP